MNEQAVEGLRKDISALWEKRSRGDVSERAFQRESEQRVLDLCRALVRRRLGEGESIRFEHHAVRAHTKIAGSVLRESEQEFISLLATERRLFRLRALHTPDQPHHPPSLVADRDDASLVRVHRDDGRLLEDDAVALPVDEGVRGPEVDREIASHLRPP